MKPVATTLLILGALLAMLAAPGCQPRSSRHAGAYPPGQPPPGYPPGQPPPGYPPGQPPPGYPPGQPPPGYPPAQPPPGYPPAQPPPGYPPAQPPPGYPPAQPPAALPPSPNDPINVVDIVFMRQRASQMLQELVAALPQTQRVKVQGIPLVTDDTVGEVNAFAACSSGKALMAITDGLLEICSQMARSRATDEVFHTRKFDAYVQLVATHQRPHQPIVRPQQSFFDGAQDADGRKVARQHELVDEQLAFVLGHELAHHYLGHTGCAGSGGGMITPADIGRVLAHAVPGFNQPNEVAADTNGVRNLLTAGRNRQAYHLTEGGALLVLNFFLALRKMTPAESILFGFELSHPHPAFRIPIVQQTANNWRATGGATIPFPIPIPGFG